MAVAVINSTSLHISWRVFGTEMTISLDYVSANNSCISSAQVSGIVIGDVNNREHTISSLQEATEYSITVTAMPEGSVMTESSDSVVITAATFSSG